MKKLILLLLTGLSLLSCQNQSKDMDETKEITKIKKATKSVNPDFEKAYELMKQNCFVCHFEKPDLSKKDHMIAPPMERIQAHYKPAYNSEEDFVKAITNWVKHPSEDKAMMPGAIRKFNLMPPLSISDSNLKLIAKALYRTDFGNPPNFNPGKNQKMSLDNGKKRKINAYTKKEITEIQKSLKDFHSDDLKAYHVLGNRIFDHTRKILLDKSYSKEDFRPIQQFFHQIEDDLHKLIAAKDIETAREQTGILQKKFDKFKMYFE